MSTGKLATVDNLIDPATATYRLKAMFGNERRKIMAWPIRQCAASPQVRKDAVVIPPLAVQRGPKRLFTWVVKADKTVEPRPIKTSITSGDRTIVVSGLQVGERVVTDGQYKLQTGASVVVVKPRTTAKQGNQT